MTDVVDILSTECEPPKFVAKHLILQQGLTLVTGGVGSGKTILALHIALSIANGIPVAGQFSVDSAAGPVLYLNGEMTRSILRLYVDQAVRGLDRPTPRGRFYFEGADGFAEFKFNSGGCERLGELVGRIAPSVIIFDTQRALFDIDENDAAEVRRAFNFIRRLCKSFGCAAMVAHHLRKIGTTSNSDRERVSGSSDIIANVDIHLALRNRDGRPFHSLMLGKTRAPIDGVFVGTEWPIEARLDGNPPRSIILAHKPTSREASANRIADEESAILELLNSGGSMTIEALGASSGNRKRAFELLCKAGSIIDSGKAGRKTLYGLPLQSGERTRE